MVKYKELDVNYSDTGNGIIEGYASTWIKLPDAYGDIIAKGAFEDSLKNRWNGGKGIPFVFSHKIDSIGDYIGIAEAEEDEKGLHFVAKFDDTPEAQRVRQLYKDGRLKKFSFAYNVLDFKEVTLENGVKATELLKLDLFEISAVCVPANDYANVVDIKSRRRCKSVDDIVEELENDLEHIKYSISKFEKNIKQLKSASVTEEDFTNDKPDDSGEDRRKSNSDLQKKLLDFIKKYENI